MTSLTCHVCRKPIEKIEDAWCEWRVDVAPRVLPYDETDKRARSTGFRIVHHHPVSPLQLRRTEGCYYDKDEKGSHINDTPLADLLQRGPEVFLGEQYVFTDEVRIRLIVRDAAHAFGRFESPWARADDLKGMLADPYPQLCARVGQMVPYLAALLQAYEGEETLAETDHARAIVNSVGGVEYLRRFVEDPLGKGDSDEE